MALDVPTVSARACDPESRARGREERRARLLQVIADGLATHLADNVDYLFHPWGLELPDPARAGERINAQLDVLERCDVLWDGLGDEQSRELLLRFFAYRAIGPAHIRLQLDPIRYRKTVIGLAAQTLRQPMVLPMQGMPMEWPLNHYDFTATEVPIHVIGSPLPIASTLAFSQYAYRDATVPARPLAGDVALDIGGCWGETALWLAHSVGPTGFVHTFEPSPGNRRVLEASLSLNRELAQRIAVWEEPVGARAGETIWMPDSVGAGATATSAPDPDRPMIEMLTESIDALIAEERILRADFIKFDVEGAELDALRGAVDTIRTCRPRLAIACYHRPDDLVEIPALIDSFGVAYRWYLQCSTMTDIDTVLFGVPA
jgi:FkbM family methyltransferase